MYQWALIMGPAQSPAKTNCFSSQLSWQYIRQGNNIFTVKLTSFSFWAVELESGVPLHPCKPDCTDQTAHTLDTQTGGARMWEGEIDRLDIKIDGGKQEGTLLQSDSRYKLPPNTWSHPRQMLLAFTVLWPSTHTHQKSKPKRVIRKCLEATLNPLRKNIQPYHGDSGSGPANVFLLENRAKWFFIRLCFLH